MADPRIRTALVSIDPTNKRPGWHGAPTPIGLLRGVQIETALWRPYPRASNIREIALHIAFWENSVANRLTGESQRLGFKQRKTSWAIQEDEVATSQWRKDIAMAKACHARLVAAVERFDPRELDKPCGARTQRPAIEFIHGVAEHNLYHGAQIKMLKTLARRDLD